MKRLAIFAALPLTLILLLCAGLFFWPSRARQALPAGATDVREYYEDSRFGADFQRCLRAKIDRADFAAFADRLGLDRTYTSADDDLGLNWTVCNEPWWTPPELLIGARFEYQEGGAYFAMAQYSDGDVYFVAFGR